MLRVSGGLEVPHADVFLSVDLDQPRSAYKRSKQAVAETDAILAKLLARQRKHVRALRRCDFSSK